MVVQPGQEVSFNATTGPRGLEQGYQNAGVIEDDEIVDGPGGGVCQVSTTLYQALVKANIEIVRSNKHSMPSPTWTWERTRPWPMITRT